MLKKFLMLMDELSGGDGGPGGGGGDISDAEVDALLGSGSEPNEIPMDDLAPETPAPAAAQPQTYDLTVNGKQVKATLEQMQKWAQQGYDYPQRMQALQKERQEFESKFKPFQEIDQYARENPEWWNHVTQQWESKANGQQNQTPTDSNNPLMQELDSLKSEIAGLRQFRDELTQEKLSAKRQDDDKQLDTEIKSMREQYAHLDWQTVDDSGRDLETLVMAYANENSIRNFDQAFKLFNHDRLLSLAEERGKESVAKDIQKKTKLGLLGKQAPKREVQQTDVRGKTYDDLLREGLEELGIA